LKSNQERRAKAKISLARRAGNLRSGGKTRWTKKQKIEYRRCKPESTLH
jgi:hypothetical protein